MWTQGKEQHVRMRTKVTTSMLAAQSTAEYQRMSWQIYKHWKKAEWTDK